MQGMGVFSTPYYTVLNINLATKVKRALSLKD
jgi:hypothetical protein